MRKIMLLAVAGIVCGATFLCAQQGGDSAKSAAEAAPAGKAYAGMYSFLKDGEFVQVTVEDEGHVTGFISRFGDGESDKGAFLNQFFKTGKLEGNKLNFTTEMVHGVSFDFKGTVERGEGKSPADEGYMVLRGVLSENTGDLNKNITSRTRSVLFKKFPEAEAPVPSARK